MVNRVFLIVILLLGSRAYGQVSDCKVTLPEISGSYSGGCKNGYAHGKGIAQGVDRYEGQFTKGLPEGRGIYKWADGTYYDGQWKAGRKNGRGKMYYKDSTMIGYWKDDNYVGEKLIAPYKVTTSLSVTRSSITKSILVGQGVKIKIMQGGGDNSTIEDFALAYDTGEEYRSGNIYGIQNASFPLYVKITYRTWNQLHTSQYNVIFEFTIYDPGVWDVILNN